MLAQGWKEGDNRNVERWEKYPKCQGEVVSEQLPINVLSMHQSLQNKVQLPCELAAVLTVLADRVGVHSATLHIAVMKELKLARCAGTAS